MKKLLSIFLSLVLMCGMLAIPALAEEAPAEDSATEETATEEAAAEGEEPAADANVSDKPLVGILAPQATHGWLAALSYYAEKEAQELGLNYRLYTYQSSAEAAGYIEELITANAKAIVAFPQAEGLEEATKMAVDAGIKIINFDVKINVEGTYFLAGDNYGMGVECAKYIADKLGGKGKVATLTITTKSNVTEDRKKGFEDTIKEIAPDIELVGDYAGESWARTDSVSVVADMLTANPELDAIFSLDDEASIGALQAIEEAGRTDIKVITGGGGAQEYFNMMKDSEINLCSALYSPAMMIDCVKMAADALEGKEIPAETIVPTTIVDKANVDEFLDTETPY